MSFRDVHGSFFPVKDFHFVQESIFSGMPFCPLVTVLEVALEFAMPEVKIALVYVNIVETLHFDLLKK